MIKKGAVVSLFFFLLLLLYIINFQNGDYHIDINNSFFSTKHDPGSNALVEVLILECDTDFPSGTLIEIDMGIDSIQTTNEILNEKFHKTYVVTIKEKFFQVPFPEEFIGFENSEISSKGYILFTVNKNEQNRIGQNDITNSRSAQNENSYYFQYSITYQVKDFSYFLQGTHDKRVQIHRD